MLGLSARAHDRILKLARTIADLPAASHIVSRDLSEAIHYPDLRPCLLGPKKLKSQLLQCCRAFVGHSK